MWNKDSRRLGADAYQRTVTIGGGIALAALQPVWLSEPGVLLTLILLFALVEYFPIRVKAGSISFAFPVGYAAFLLFQAPGAAWAAALGAVAANAVRRRSLRVTLFNGAQMALAHLATGHLVTLWPGFPTRDEYVLSILVYVVLYNTLNNLLVDVLLWLRPGAYSRADWLTKTRYAALTAAVSLGCCLLMKLLASQGHGHRPHELLFFFLPLLAAGVVTHLLTNLARFVRQMQTLMEVSTLSTASPGECSAALGTALARLRDFFECRYAAVYAASGDLLVLNSLLGVSEERFSHPRLAWGEGITGTAAQQGEPVLAQDAARDPRNAAGEGAREGASLLLAIPLVSSGQVTGVLTVAKERSHSIVPEDMRLLTIFANLIAAILRNQQIAEQRERLLLLNERNRLARDIHDGLAQSLAGAILQLDRLERLVESDVRSAQKLTRFLREYLRESLLDVRRSIHNLRPSPVEANGLVHAVQVEADRALAKDQPVSLRLRGKTRRLSALVEDEVFRIVQEGLANALKHAGATRVTVTLIFAPTQLRAVVQDNGAGFVLGEALRSSQQNSSFGLIGMSERADRLGARLEIAPKPGYGTRLLVDVPLMGE